MDKYLIVDGNSVLNRAYFALPEWRNRAGEATAGVYGFLSMLLKAMDELKPSHLVVVFDSREGENFRKAMYVGYHANRGRDIQIEEDIWSQVEKLKIVFEKMGVVTLSVAGVEADDVIGSVCKKVEKEKTKAEVYVITGDRDLMQLVNQEVKLVMPQRGLSDTAIVDKDKVKERLGVWPEQVIDYKALVGDSSDNYPGVPGIGPKSAVDLLEKFGTFEKLLATVNKGDNKVSEGIKRKLTEGKAGGELSKQLATIKTDVPLEVDLSEAVVPTEEKMVSVFRELGHKSLVRRVSGEDVVIDDSQQKLFE